MDGDSIPEESLTPQGRKGVGQVLVDMREFREDLCEVDGADSRASDQGPLDLVGACLVVQVRQKG